MVHRSAMAVSLDTYRARIGLYNLRASARSDNITNVSSIIGICTSKHPDIAIMYFCITIISILLLISGDVKLNPGPRPSGIAILLSVTRICEA